MGGGPDDDLAGLGGGLQAAGGVHDVAHRGVVAAGAERTDEHLAGVHADAEAEASTPLSAPQSAIELLHAQRGAHRALGVVLVGDGAPKSATIASPMILSTWPPKVVDVGDEAFEAAVDEVLDVLGVASSPTGS